MKALPWFRMYTDFLDDPKMIALAFEDQRHFIGVLALKSAGVLEVDCTPKLIDRIVAQRLWIDYAIIEDVKKRLVNTGLIDEWWQPLAWDKRQMPSDFDPTGAERQRKHREEKRNALRNAPVTPPEEIRGEEIREEKKRERTARGSRLPEDFQCDFEFAVEAGIQNTLEEAHKFRDYWKSQPGQKGVKLDWPATWRNWCRNAKPTARQNAYTRPDPSLTVPSRPGIDPALAKAIKDGLAASKPSAETLAKINQLRSQPA